jgi:DNA invertase Pin-like site-specific DNA recombinase
MNTTMRILGYARVSSDAQEKDGTSLEAQQAAIVAYCRSRGWSAPRLFVEVESGGEESREKRVELDRLLAAVVPGDQILVTYVDRWSRDIVFAVDSVRKLTRRDIGWIAIGEQTGDEIDATTDRGMRELIDRAADAEKERARIKQRTVGARRRLRARGCYVEGRPPMGYRVEKRRLVIDEATAPIVRRLFELCIAGRSCREVSSALRAEYPGTVGIDPVAVARRIRDRRYLGEMNTIGTRGRKAPRGEWIKAHEAIIDQATWDQAQTASAARKMGGRPLGVASRSAVFLLRGIARCAGCGHPLASNSPEASASVKHGGYYQCERRVVRDCKGVRAPYKAVDADLEVAVRERLALLAGRLAAVKQARQQSAAPDHAGQRAKLIRRRDTLLDAISEGIVSGAEARGKVEKLRAEIAALDRMRAPEPAPVRGAPVDAVRAWDTLKPDEKHAAIGKLVERVEVVNTATKKWERGAWKLRIAWRPCEARA